MLLRGRAIAALCRLLIVFLAAGNYGVPGDEKGALDLLKHFESNSIHVTGLIIADYSHEPSHYLATRSLSAWLTAHGVPAMYGLDTRLLTKKIRQRGAMLGKLLFNGEDVKFEDPNLRNLVAEGSRKKPETFGGGQFKVIAVDCGIKNNIIRYLVSKGLEVKVVPW